MIEIRDEDGFLWFGDDLADIDPDVDAVFVDFNVNLATCEVSGEVSGSCGEVFVRAGTNPADDESDGRAEVHFKVDVLGPAEAPETLVRCTHRPIWPSPGDTVEVTVESLNGVLDPRIADTVEIWLGGNLLDSRSGRTRFSATFQTSADSFVYGCRVEDTPIFTEDPLFPVFSGWRRVQQGLPPSGQAVPVLFGAEGRGEKPFLQYQHLLNIWLALESGEAMNFAGGMCTHVTPPSFDTEYLFAETVAILHTDTMLRDCATGARLLSAEAPNVSSSRTLLHETGHRPFGLADEYCYKRPGSMSTVCDGGYFENGPFPNVFETLMDCEADAVAEGRPTSACQEWESDRANNVGPWYTHDPVVDDLMVDRETVELLDLRKIRWLFELCQMNGTCKDP